MAQSIPNIQFQIIDNTTADVTGTLDIKDITNFPISLTYSIKDVQDPQSSKGSYSKTFKLPATGNNNKIFKNLYSDSLYDSFQYIEDKDAQIFVDGVMVFQGKFQMKGTAVKGIPQSYECVVFGDNFQWVNRMSELNLCDINFSAGGLFPDAPTTIANNRQEIEDTWEFGMAGETIDGVQTHIVYPIVNTGQWNFNDPVSDEPIVTPSDMFPAFYLYNMLQCIFAEQGYTIESEFLNSDWFKRLVTLVIPQNATYSETTLETNQFEIERSSYTPYKKPSDYTVWMSTTDCGDLPEGSSWYDGALANSTIISDPSGSVTIADTHTPNIDPQTPSGIAQMTSEVEPTISGWWPFTYGQGVGSESPRLPYFADSLCEPYDYVPYGLDWNCVKCDFQTEGSTTTQSIPMTCDTFQTSFYGLYEFSGELTTTMERYYAVVNPIIDYDDVSTAIDPLAYVGSGAWRLGTGQGGDSTWYAGYGTYPTPDNTGFDPEYYVHRVTYVANTFIMHYKEATGKTHAILVDSKRNYYQSLEDAYPNLFQSGWGQGQTLPLSGQEEFEMSFEGVQLEILDDEDKVYLYTEVNAELQRWTVNQYAQTVETMCLCQCKYRQKSTKFRGQLCPEVIEGGSRDLNSFLPCDVSQLDYVNGLTGLFNLMWQTNETTKTITVEPRQEFFLTPAQANDWTDKLDKSKDEKSKYIYSALKRNLCFSYTHDGKDVFVEERNKLVNQKCELGSHAMNLGELYENAEQTIGSDFYSPTYMFYDKSISTNQQQYRAPFVPVIHQEYTEIWNMSPTFVQPDKLESFNPRLLMWFGLQPLNQEDGVTPNNGWRWGYNNNISPHEIKTTYPFAGCYSDQDATLAGSVEVGSDTFENPSLMFDTQLVNAVSGSPPYTETTGLYDMFWEYNILSLLDRPKIKTAYFKLTPNDIATLNFRKLIFIRSAQSDTYWILNKIDNYNCTKNGLTKVELFEWHNARPLKGKFPSISTGWGNNFTPIWADYVSQLSKGGHLTVDVTKLQQKNLGIYKETRTPLLDKGTRATSLTSKKPLTTEIADAKQKTYTSDGSRIPFNAKINSGSNVGQNKNINTGAITVGRNLKGTSTSGLIIGQGGTNPKLGGQQAIKLVQNGNVAMSVSPTGMFMEGGGGVIYFEDTGGDMREVMTGIQMPKNTSTGVIPYYYTRVLKSSETDF